MKRYPSIEIDDLAAVIRDSIAAHKTSGDEQVSFFEGQAENRTQGAPELKLQPDFQPHSNDRYHVNDLLKFHDRTFLYAAYQAILKRSPDEAEFLRDRKRMQTGQLNKIDLLAALRFSPEGKAKRVDLGGLAVPAFVRRLGRIPVVGYLLNLSIGILRLPKQVHDQRQLAAYILAQNQQIADFANVVASRVADSRNEIFSLEEKLSRQAELNDKHATLLAMLDETLKARLQELDQHLNSTQANLQHRIDVSRDIMLTRIESEVGRRLELRQLILDQQDSLTTLQNKLQAEMERLNLGLQHARSQLSLQRGKTDAKPVSSIQPASASGTHELDALYAALEDRFRGTRAEIKERFQSYVPYVKESYPVVDLGCGRGEWLEVLKEEGIAATGVDRNVVQIEQCRTHGLDVAEGDFITHLQTLADASIGAITGFHIIEHVSIETLFRLLDEVMRVLRPGGVVIFETPNPENLIVAGNFFYLDPTHRHPLPSQLMTFLLHNHGFNAIEIMNLHPWDSGKVQEKGELADRLNHYFYGPMDYAVIGRKVGP